ncbi:MAG: trehalose-phosphatase, partial [Candidatus Omnitrophica bacterium]|nr:trehalose-phosphatase [Candidatus Omnitrophota bacterium]
PFPQAVLEDKHLSLSLHHRLLKKDKLRRLRKIFLNLVKPSLAAQQIRLTQGKKVWEVRPPIKWDKGRALLWLIQRLGRKRGVLPIFIGDDLTDEDGFRAVNKIGGISILVRKKKTSQAQYYLNSTKDTEKFLQQLVKIR